MIRKFLVRITWIFTGIAFLAIAYVFIQGMSPSQKAVNQKEHIINLASLDIGKPVKIQTKLGSIFLLKPSPEQIANLQKLDNHVWDKDYVGYEKDLNLFVTLGISTRHGCGLEHAPLGESPIYRNYGIGNWLGGYFDPCHDSSYDYAGRTIKSYEYTYKGLDIQVPNLNAPNYKLHKQQLIVEL